MIKETNERNVAMLRRQCWLHVTSNGPYDSDIRHGWNTGMPSAIKRAVAHFSPYSSPAKGVLTSILVTSWFGNLTNYLFLQEIINSYYWINIINRATFSLNSTEMWVFVTKKQLNRRSSRWQHYKFKLRHI